MLLGAVGAYDWNGTVVMHTPAGTLVPGKAQFYDPHAEAGYEGLAGYLGELSRPPPGRGAPTSASAGGLAFWGNPGPSPGVAAATVTETLVKYVFIIDI